MTAFLELLRRDLLLGLRHGTGRGTALGFYLVVVAVLPLGLGPDLALLGRIAPGVLWIGLLLSALLSAGGIFVDDARDGTLDLLALGPLSFELVTLAKIAAHWLTTALPLIVLAPLLALMLNLPFAAYDRLLVAMLVGSPAVSAIATIGAALTVGVQRGGLVLALVVLPLYIPTLVFGVGATGHGEGVAADRSAPLAILGAISLVSLVLAPIATAAALRLQMR